MIKITQHITTTYGKEYTKELRFADINSLFQWIVQWGNSTAVQTCSLCDPDNNAACNLFSFTLNKERISVAMVRDEATNDIYYSDGSLTRGQKHLSDKLLPYIEKARKEMEKPVYRFI